jgi:hypothetical protein
LRIDNLKLFFNAKCELLEHIGDGSQAPVLRDAAKESKLTPLPKLQTPPEIERRLSG